MKATDRELVAVPDADATPMNEGSRYRLGIRPTKQDAVFTLGETGPNGQTFPWVYLRGEGATYEIDLLDGELTVSSRPDGDDSVQAVVYKIDVESMTGQEIKPGEALRIVFDYDHNLFTDETTKVDNWVATTGPRFVEELRTRLGKTDEIVLDLQADIEDATKVGRFGHASRAPRSATPLHGTVGFDGNGFAPTDQSANQPVNQPTIGMVDLRTVGGPETPDVEEVIDITDSGLDGNSEGELEEQDPGAVQVVDPATGVVYVGRKWGRGKKTSLRKLKNASYRVAILVLHNGESATIVLQHPKNLPAMQLTTKHGVVRQFLAPDAWDMTIDPQSPNSSLRMPVAEPMGGDRPIPRGFISLAPVDEVVGTGPQAKAALPYPKCDALAKFRDREQDLSGNRTLSRSLHVA